MENYVSLADLESDPRYRNATAEEQSNARALWFQSYGVNTPGYAEADNATKFQVQDAVMNRAPVLGSDDERAAEWMQVADRAQAGDQQAIDRARQIHLENMVAESGGLVSWLGTKILAAAGVEDFQGTDDPEALKDRKKAFEYFQAKTSQNDRVMDWTMTAANLGISGAGLVTDILLFKGAGKLLGMAAAGIGGEGAIARAAQSLTAYGAAASRAEMLQVANISQRAKFILGDVVPGLGQAVAEGAAITGTQLLHKQEAEQIFGTVSPALQQQALVLFGQNALIDIGAWSLFRALKPVGLFFKTTRAKAGEAAEMTDEQIGEAIHNFTTGRDLSPDQAGVMAKIAVDHPKAWEGYFAVRYQAWKTANSLDIDSPEFIEFMAAQRSKGEFAIGRTPDGLVGLFDSGNKALGKYTTHKEAFEALDAHLVKVDDQMTKAKASPFVKPDSVIQLQIHYKGTITAGASDTQAIYLANAFSENVTGQLDFKPFAAVESAMPGGLPFRQVTESEFLKAGGKSTTAILIPKTIKKEQTRKLLDTVTVGATHGKLASLGDPKVADLFQATQKNLTDLTRDTYTQSWVNQTARTLGAEVKQTPQGLVLKTADGLTRNFTRMDSLATYLMNQAGQITDSQFAQIMRHDHGLDYKVIPARVDELTGKPIEAHVELRQMAGGGGKSVSGGEIVRGKDMADILDQRPDLRPKLPPSAAPHMMMLSNDGKFAVNGRVFTGSYKTAKDLNNQFFWDANKLETSLQPKEAIVRTIGDRELAYNIDGASYSIKIPKMNITLHYDTLDAATADLARFGQNYSDLEKVAAYKGLQMNADGSTIYFRGVGDDAIPVRCDGLDEALLYLKSQPNPADDALEMTGMFNNLEEVIKNPALKELVKASRVQNGKPLLHNHELERAIQDHHYKGHPQPIRDWTGHIIDGMDSQFRKLSTVVDDKRVYRIYDLISSTHVTYKGRANQIDHLLTGITRNLKKADREYLTQMFKYEPEQYAEEWLKLTKRKWEPRLEVAMNQTRQLLSQHKDLFGVDPWITLKNYFPQFKEALIEDAKKHGGNPAESVAQFFKRSKFGDNLPVELRFFAENMRMQDFAAFAESTTFDEVVGRYLHRGYKKLFMDDALKEAKDLGQALVNEGKLTEGQALHVAEFIRTAEGMASTTLERLSGEATEKFAYNLRTWMNKIAGKSDKEVNVAHQDMVDFFKALTVSSTMAFRPGLVARNLQQIYMTLTPIMGNDWVDAAMKELSKRGNFKMLTAAIDDSRAQGHLMGSISPLGELESHKGLLAAWNKTGMKWYQDSDVVTRLVVDKSVEMAWKRPNEIFEASAKTADDIKRFLADTRLDGLDPVHQRTIMETYQKFGAKQAMTKAQELMQNFTMFSYQKFDNPMSGKGFIGKIFGMFGHYPQHYASMVKTIATNPNKFRAATMAYNMATTSAAFYLVGEQTLGISSRNFMPWNQMMFTGGPYWDYLNTLSVASDEWTGRSSPQSKLAATQLPAQTFQLMTPFGMNIRNMAVKGPQLFAEGDWYGGALTILSLPYASDADHIMK